jgi:hypothetical protein
MAISQGSDARFLADLLDIARRRPEDLQYWMDQPGYAPPYHVPGSDPDMENMARSRRMRDIEMNDAALRGLMGGSYKIDGPRDVADLFPHARTAGMPPSKTSERVHSGMNVDVVRLGRGQYAVMSKDDAREYHKLQNQIRRQKGYRRDPRRFMARFLASLREKAR